ncbi:hypothetical protein DFH07DRAFT_779777 [Mycena maculata]|uniref:Uncharacterized protein n=1 Tax=Mycena maculata TaxID=230809 RepID=A0AAD7I860_9AGAR|nr:hypothetical protein DFH07DRAFT_779777 [Mycena maculata]
MFYNIPPIQGNWAKLPALPVFAQGVVESNTGAWREKCLSTRFAARALLDPHGHDIGRMESRPHLQPRSSQHSYSSQAFVVSLNGYQAPEVLLSSLTLPNFLSLTGSYRNTAVNGHVMRAVTGRPDLEDFGHKGLFMSGYFELSLEQALHSTQCKQLVNACNHILTTWRPVIEPNARKVMELIEDIRPKLVQLGGNPGLLTVAALASVITPALGQLTCFASFPDATLGDCTGFIATFCASIAGELIQPGDTAAQCFPGPTVANLNCAIYDSTRRNLHITDYTEQARSPTTSTWTPAKTSLRPSTRSAGLSGGWGSPAGRNSNITSTPTGKQTCVGRCNAPQTAISEAQLDPNAYLDADAKFAVSSDAQSTAPFLLQLSKFGTFRICTGSDLNIHHMPSRNACGIFDSRCLWSRNLPQWSTPRPWVPARHSRAGKQDFESAALRRCMFQTLLSTSKPNTPALKTTSSPAHNASRSGLAHKRSVRHLHAAGQPGAAETSHFIPRAMRNRARTPSLQIPVADAARDIRFVNYVPTARFGARSSQTCPYAPGMAAVERPAPRRCESRAPSLFLPSNASRRSAGVESMRSEFPPSHTLRPRDAATHPTCSYAGATTETSSTRIGDARMRARCRPQSMRGSAPRVPHAGAANASSRHRTLPGVAQSRAPPSARAPPRSRVPASASNLSVASSRLRSRTPMPLCWIPVAQNKTSPGSGNDALSDLGFKGAPNSMDSENLETELERMRLVFHVRIGIAPLRSIRTELSLRFPALSIRSSSNTSWFWSGSFLPTRGVKHFIEFQMLRRFLDSCNLLGRQSLDRSKGVWTAARSVTLKISRRSLFNQHAPSSIHDSERAPDSFPSNPFHRRPVPRQLSELMPQAAKLLQTKPNMTLTPRDNSILCSLIRSSTILAADPQGLASFSIPDESTPVPSRIAVKFLPRTLVCILLLRRHGLRPRLRHSAFPGSRLCFTLHARHPGGRERVGTYDGAREASWSAAKEKEKEKSFAPFVSSPQNAYHARSHGARMAAVPFPALFEHTRNAVEHSTPIAMTLEARSKWFGVTARRTQ